MTEKLEPVPCACGKIPCVASSCHPYYVYCERTNPNARFIEFTCWFGPHASDRDTAVKAWNAVMSKAQPKRKAGK